jgi:hypothetical protein
MCRDAVCSRLTWVFDAGCCLCAGDATSDVRLLDAHHLVLATPQQWDMLSRRWKQRKAVQAVGLFIADELQLLGGQQGPTLEVICSRMRYMSSQLATPVRLVGFSHRCVLAELQPPACMQDMSTMMLVGILYLLEAVQGRC